MKAYLVICRYFIAPENSIVKALNPDQAKYRVWKAAKDAGFHSITFGDFKARRAEQFDRVPLEPLRCYAEDYAVSIATSDTSTGSNRTLKFR